MLGALTFGGKFAMAGLANIEPVSLFVMLFAVTFGWKCLFPIGVYVVMEYLVYGIGIWNLYYLYVWAVLALLALGFRKMQEPLGWAILSGTFGLLFGALCGLMDAVLLGPGPAVAKWVSGIPFDLLHCAGNFFLALLLFRPLRQLLEKLYAYKP